MDNDGKTPLHHAASDGHAEMVELLLERGAHINARDNYGRTALDYADPNINPVVAALLHQTGVIHG